MNDFRKNKTEHIAVFWQMWHIDCDMSHSVICNANLCIYTKNFLFFEQVSWSDSVVVIVAIVLVIREVMIRLEISDIDSDWCFFPALCSTFRWLLFKISGHFDSSSQEKPEHPISGFMVLSLRHPHDFKMSFMLI